MKIWHIKTIVATIVSVILFILLMVIILWQQGIIKPTSDNGDLSQEGGEEENNPGIVRPWLAMLCIISIDNTIAVHS